MRCLYVTRTADGNVTCEATNRPESELPDGDTLVQVEWSALNYKDALAATGHAGVVRSFPHVPGIDAVGKVVQSGSASLQSGDSVIVTSYGLGADRWGAWCERIRVPQEWVIPLPAGLSPREAIVMGTAGLTAGMSLECLQRHDVLPGRGPVVVTGATGGVGIFAVHLLARCGYQVAAVTGKADAHSFLQRWGATQVLNRDEVINLSTRPLLAARWVGAIDTVGGTTLSTLLRELRPGGCVAACGLVGGADFSSSVYPFLLRGVTLAGIDSATFPADRRQSLWTRLSSDWKPDANFLREIATETDLDGLPIHVARILAGKVQGRVIVRVS